jgi:hypothetical protein
MEKRLPSSGRFRPSSDRSGVVASRQRRLVGSLTRLTEILEHRAFAVGAGRERAIAHRRICAQRAAEGVELAPPGFEPWRLLRFNSLLTVSTLERTPESTVDPPRSSRRISCRRLAARPLLRRDRPDNDPAAAAARQTDFRVCNGGSQERFHFPARQQVG